MALSFIQAAGNGPSTATAAAVLFVPASATNGDLLVLQLVTIPPTSVTVAPSGWTKIIGASAGVNFAGVKVGIWWKQASAEPLAYTATISASDFYSTTVVAVRGQNGSSSAIDVSASNFSASGNSMIIPSIATTKPNDIQLGFVAQLGDSTHPAQFDIPVTFTTANKVFPSFASQAVGYRSLVASGASGTAVFSATGSTAVNPWVGISVGILESAAAAVALMRLQAMLGVGT